MGEGPVKIERHGTPIPSNRIYDPMMGDSDGFVKDIPDYWDSVPHQREQQPSECKVRKASPEEIAAELARLGIK